MITYREITNKDGNAESMASGCPMPFEVECLIDYSIDPGQRGIFNAPMDQCCPEYPACVEDIQLISATILYGSKGYELTRESRWWEIIEEEMNDDENLKVEIFEFEEHEQEESW